MPSEVPAFDQIHDRVTRDYQMHEAATKARTAGTNFYYGATVQMAMGKTFAQIALAAGQTPFALKPFSLSSQEVPEAEGHAEINADQTRGVHDEARTRQPVRAHGRRRVCAVRSIHVARG